MVSVATDEAFGAFLRNYRPKLEQSASLEKYLVSIGVKHPGIDGFVGQEAQTYVEALDRHFNRLKEFLGSNEE